MGVVGRHQPQRVAAARNVSGGEKFARDHERGPVLPALLARLGALRRGLLRRLLRATGAPFDTKDALKARGYRWDGSARVWFRTLPGDDPWCREFLRPLVSSAGYRIVEDGEAPVDLEITFDRGAKEVLLVGADRNGGQKVPHDDYQALTAALQNVRAGRRA